ncbi:RHS repeat domain-containing protein [Maribacter sp. 2210JD10-5]|uniref:RHS repeat domain-containing protein n=1 Tax=Maribacter sp. 2210JD10-5 TaxID=3386272 RepID=UPI0039BD6C32
MKYLLLIIIVLSSVRISNAQLNSTDLAPANPDVAALTKFVVTPVNKYTGIPSIGIPLYTVNVDNVSLPISIDYHAGGIMVNEEASSVGLGWALNAGGVITRTIAMNDDYDVGRLFPDAPDVVNPRDGFVDSDGDCNFLVNGVPTYVRNVGPSEGTNDGWEPDSVPDTYYYNFAGYSGSFMRDEDGTIKELSNKTDLIIYIDEGGGSIRTPDGATYEFTQKQFTYPTGGVLGVVQSWYLTKITSNVGAEITFEYMADGRISRIPSFFQSYTAYTGTLDTTPAIWNQVGPITQTDQVLLKKITAPNIKIEFDYSVDGEREDIKNSHSLNAVKVYDCLEKDNNSNCINQKLVKNYDLVYSYFGNNTDPSLFTSQYNLNKGDYADFVNANSDPSAVADWSSFIDGSFLGSDIRLRLKLDSIIEDDIKPYSFVYNESSEYPTKTTLSQDYWGFYNGVFNPSIFIPDITSIYAPGAKPAKRYPVQKHAKIFSLNRINYPTGGYKKIDLELNTYDQQSIPGPYGNSHPFSVDPTTDGFKFPSIHSGNLASDSGPDDIQEMTIDFNFAELGGTSDGYFNITADFVVMNLTENRQYQFSPARVWLTDENNNLIDGINGFNRYFTSSVTSEPLLPPENGILARKFTKRIFADHNITYRLHASWGSSAYVGDVSVRAEWIRSAHSLPFSSGAGLRVKSIAEFDSDNREELRSDYNYHTKLSSGHERSNGNLFYYPRYRTDALSLAKELTPYLANLYADQHPLLAKSESLNPLLKETGGFVGYTKVDVKKVSRSGEDNGLSEYYYHCSVPQKEFSPEHRRFYNNMDFVYDFPEIKYPHNGLLSKEIHYDNNGKLVRKIENDYQINGVHFPSDVNLSDYRIPLSTPLLSIDYKEIFDNADYILGWKTYHAPIPPLGTTGDRINGNVRRVLGNRTGIGIYSLAELDEYRDNHNDNNPPQPWIYHSDGPNHIANYEEYFDFICGPAYFKFRYHPYYSHVVQPSATREFVYDSNGENPVVSVNKFFYDSPNHLQRTGTELIDSEGNTIKTKIYYPDDIDGVNGLVEGGTLSTEAYNAIGKMKRNGESKRVGTPIQTVTELNGEKSIKRINFEDWGPNSNNDDAIISVKTIQTSKGANSLEDRVVYHEYDDEGNPLEVSKADGVHLVYVWGYNYEYPIAKIENATFEEGFPTTITTQQQGLIDQVVANSELDIDKNSEETLIAALETLREGFPQAMVTTYTYDLLVGVTSITDPRGYTMYYAYDDLNRLKEVRDGNGDLVTDYEYRYKGQINE